MLSIPLFMTSHECACMRDFTVDFVSLVIDKFSLFTLYL